MSFLKKFRDFVLQPSHTRTAGVLAMMVLVSAVFLTVNQNQQQQTLKQRAASAEANCTVTFSFQEKIAGFGIIPPFAAIDGGYNPMILARKETNDYTFTFDNVLPGNYQVFINGRSSEDNGVWKSTSALESQAICSSAPQQQQTLQQRADFSAPASDLPLCEEGLIGCRGGSSEDVCESNRPIKCLSPITGLENLNPFQNKIGDKAIACCPTSKSTPTCVKQNGFYGDGYSCCPGLIESSDGTCQPRNSPEGQCESDGNDCTNDHYVNGTCINESVSDGSVCTKNGLSGTCSSGTCTATAGAIKNGNKCTSVYGTYYDYCNSSSSKTTYEVTGQSCLPSSESCSELTPKCTGATSPSDSSGGAPRCVVSAQGEGSACDNSGSKKCDTGLACDYGACVGFPCSGTCVKEKKASAPAPNCENSTCTPNETCVGRTSDTGGDCLKKGTGGTGSNCGKLDKTPNNEACASGVCDPTKLTCSAPTATSVNLTLTLNYHPDAIDSGFANGIPVEFSLHNPSAKDFKNGTSVGRSSSFDKVSPKKFSASIPLANITPNKYLLIARQNDPSTRFISNILIAKTLFTLSPDQTAVTARETTLVLGDINNDNDINIEDYNTFKTCYKKNIISSPECSSSNLYGNDFDDATVDQIDYNTWLRGFKAWSDEGK